MDRLAGRFARPAMRYRFDSSSKRVVKHGCHEQISYTPAKKEGSFRATFLTKKQME
ncbi:hypothetical protein B4113_3319 [Geobacillus sp. B4113_201601]|nr:hypothetical protein B4113_3319 [Geobacillus sp. B4113_201601]